MPILEGFKCYHSYQNLFKIIQTGIHLALLTLGTFSLLNLAYKRNISFSFVIMPLVIAVLFIEFRTTERRYVMHVFPFYADGVSCNSYNYRRTFDNILQESYI